MAVLAFYAKQYYAGGAAFLAVYLFLSVSKRAAVLFAIGYAAMLLLSLIVVHRTSPYFLDNTVWSVFSASGSIRSLDSLLNQLKQFALVYAGVFAALLYGRLRREKPAREDEPHQQQFTPDFNNWSEALFPHWQPPFFWAMFWCASFVIVVSLGWHPANYMSYLFQLMSPFLLPAAFASLVRWQAPLLLTVPLLAGSSYFSWDMLQKEFEVDPAGWQRADRLISEHDHILASQILLLPLMQQDKRIYQAGHTFYFKYAADKPAWFLHQPESHQISSIWKNYMADLYQRVEQQKFDLVMLHAWDVGGIFNDPPAHVPEVKGSDYFKRFYRRQGAVRLSLTKRPGGGNKKIQIWVPREGARVE